MDQGSIGAAVLGVTGMAFGVQPASAATVTREFDHTFNRASGGTATCRVRISNSFNPETFRIDAFTRVLTETPVCRESQASIYAQWSDPDEPDGGADVFVRGMGGFVEMGGIRDEHADDLRTEHGVLWNDDCNITDPVEDPNNCIFTERLAQPK